MGMSINVIWNYQMKFKFLKFTCLCLVIFTVFGMKLSYAAPILLTFDWTGQCDDCQGLNGANNVPGRDLNDGIFQEVSGVLTISYDPASTSTTITSEMFRSFDYGGSSILNPFSLRNEGDFIGYMSIVDNRVVINSFKYTYANAYFRGGEFRLWLTRDSAYPTLRRYLGGKGVIVDFGESDWDISIYSDVGLSSEVTRITRCGGYGGCSSRDEGIGSTFVMRGTLPLPPLISNPIPEPSMIAIFVLGLLGLGLRSKGRA
ncbi:MAG: hypothetical protein ACJAYN_003295 [Bermanella sp.]|jgi:hypothetical protein